MNSSRTISTLQAERKRLLGVAEDFRDSAERAGRDLTPEESRKAHEAMTRVEQIDAELNRGGAPVAAFAPGDMSPRYAVPRGQRSEHTYRPDNYRDANFWADKLSVRENSSSSFEARDRLNQSEREAMAYFEATYGSDYAGELRAMGDVSTAGGDFLPPLYLADLWVHPNMAGRPLADRLPKYPLPPTGTAISIPDLVSGVTVAARASGGSVSATDGVTKTIAHTVNEYAGYVDIDRIAVMRSDPGLQEVLTRTLVRRYNVALDTDLLSGSGTAPHHCGIDNIGTGLNTVTWTQGSPTPAKFLSQVQLGISDIDTNRLEVSPDICVLHGRRMTWGAQPNATTFPLFQQNGLFHAQGTQDGGFIETIAGLEVIKDNNITTTAGAGTNQDKAYLLVSEDFLLAEGPLYARVHEDVGSATGTIRFAVFGHSAFLSKRYPTGAAIITGTGMAAPVFDS
jgi:HK97 family phage major capsid protein